MAAGAGFATTALAGTLVGQIVWTGRRRLPSQTPPSHAVQVFAGTPDARRPMLRPRDHAAIDAAGSRDGEPSRDQLPLRVVALGDSTLTGPGLERCDQVWLPVALSMIDSAWPIEYVSLAVGGSRAVDAVARVREALLFEPDVVVVAVGANDALHGVPVRRIRSRLDQLVTALLLRVEVVAIANVGDLGNIARVPAPLSSFVRARARRVCRVVEQVVSAHDRAVLLDVTPADHVFLARSVYTPDLFHPGPDGHAAWARAVLPQLRIAVERAGAQPSGGGVVEAHAAGRTSLQPPANADSVAPPKNDDAAIAAPAATLETAGAASP